MNSRKTNISLAIMILLAAMVILPGCKKPNEKLFTNISTHSKISFANNIKETPDQNILNYEYMYNGGGVAVGDVNKDGLPDIYFTGNQVGNKLYLNTSELKFEDVTDKAGVGGKSSWATGVTMVDINGDDLLDIYVCYSGKGNVASRANLLYINQGVKNGVPLFLEKAAEYGIDAPGCNSTQAAFFDYDRDGDLDMFLLNHAIMLYSPFVNTTKLRSKHHPYFSNRFYKNENGRFIDITSSTGIKGGGNNFGLGISVSDINNDDWLDIYVTTDFEEQDFLYINNHDGTFREITKSSLNHISKNGMGCDVADYNNDGLMDIVVVDMLPEDNKRQKMLKGPDEYDKYNLLVDSGYFHQNMRNTLQLNVGIDAKTGNPAFSEIGQLAGISNTDWSWSPLLADYDNDGNKDLFVTNGFLRDFTNLDFINFTVAEYRNKYGAKVPADKLINELPSTKVSNYIFRNKGDLTFENVTDDWGLYHPNITNGAAHADLDNDGDLDIIVNNLNEVASIYRNNSNNNEQNFIKIRLKALGQNTHAIGAKVTIISVGNNEQTAELSSVRGFQSSVEPLIHFGIGKETQLKEMIIRWPDGKHSRLNDVKVNTTHNINESDVIYDTTIIVKDTPSLFIEYTKESGIVFTQNENQFVDFKTEFLLPWQLSKQGPRLAKADVNDDGLEDVFIGAPIGQSAQLYLQTASERFILSSSQPWSQDAISEDIQPVFFDADGDTDLDLYVVSGGNEPHTVVSELQDRLYINGGNGKFVKSINSLPVCTASKSCVAAADYNKDGKMDLFVGGRLIAGKYGISPESYLLRNETTGGKIKFSNSIIADAKDLQFAGMVTDAVWHDINHDGWVDLMVVGEWMAIQIFINNKGKLENHSKQYGLEYTGGLWTRIFPGDMDEDGDMDFLLGNLAPNTQFRASVKEPMTLCVNDFLKNGKFFPVISYYIQGVSYPYASRDELAEPMPILKKKFLRYTNYSTATLKSIFTKEQLAGMKELYVHTLKNCWLQNDGNGKLTLKELPTEAQFSAIQGAVSGDFDENGTNEILTAGNFYPFRVQLGRQDASKGVIIKVDKNGKANASSCSTAGVVIDGDVRDMVSVKTKGNKMLMVIAKNNTSVQIIKNN